MWRESCMKWTGRPHVWDPWFTFHCGNVPPAVWLLKYKQEVVQLNTISVFVWHCFPLAANFIKICNLSKVPCLPEWQLRIFCPNLSSVKWGSIYNCAQCLNTLCVGIFLKIEDCVEVGWGGGWLCSYFVWLTALVCDNCNTKYMNLWCVCLLRCWSHCNTDISGAPSNVCLLLFLSITAEVSMLDSRS